jgi:hypothetical protein
MQKVVLCGPPNASRRFFLAADVRHLVQHVTNATPVDNISRCNLMMKLPGPTAQPNINSFFESELGFSWVVVLNDSFGHARVPFVEMETRKRLC